MSRLRLAYLMQHLGPGGAERQAIATLNALVESYPVEAALFILKPEDQTPQITPADEIEVHEIRWGNRYDFRVIPRLRRELAEFNPDVLHVWTQSLFLYGCLSRPRGSKMIYGHLNSGVTNQATGAPRNLKEHLEVRMLKNCADLHLFNSRAGLENWGRLSGISGEHSRVLPNYIRLPETEVSERELEALRNEFNTREHPWVLLCVGRIHLEVKGQDALVKALQAVEAGAGPGLVLFAGNGPDDDEFAELAAGYSGDSELKLLGWRDDLSALLKVPDLLVIPSRSEGYCNVIVEAMAAGTPLVSTRVGAAPELLEGTGNAKLAPPDDPETLARETLAALEELGELERRAEEVKRNLSEHYDPELVLQRHYELYRELADSR